jgi:hypothetical protein
VTNEALLAEKRLGKFLTALICCFLYLFLELLMNRLDGGWTKGPTDYLVSSYKPGEYKAVYEIDTSNLQPGLWKTTFYVCQGECGSKWPHSKLFSKHTVEWTMPN